MSYIYSMQEILEDVAKQHRQLVVNQFSDMIQAGVLIVQKSTPAIVRDFANDKYEVKQVVEFTYKGEEIIKQLTEENEKLKAELAELQDTVADLLEPLRENYE